MLKLRTTPPWPGLGLHVVVKPIGPMCNLRCRYCFYLEKESLYGSGESWRMTHETLDVYIRQYVEAQPRGIEVVEFTFQGGEPTLMGLDFFRRAVELERKYLPPGKRPGNSLQTNGLLLDDAWCEFLAQNQFLVGLSLDGPEDLHDAYRTDAAGRGSFDRVLRALRCMQKHGVKFNVIACIHRGNADHPLRVYRFLRDCGVQYIQFIPVVQLAGNAHDQDHATANSALCDVQPPAPQPSPARGEDVPVVTAESVLPEKFGRFLIAIFDEWAKDDVERVQIGDFDQALMTWARIGPTVCVSKPVCGRSLALEHNGDLYACDHFVDRPYRLGNIHESTISQMANSQRQEEFGHAKLTSLPSSCRQCELRFVCNGGCRKDRFLRDPSGEHGLNYLCAGYRMFFTHIAPAMRAVAEGIRAGRSPAQVMRQLQTPNGASPGLDA